MSGVGQRSSGAVPMMLPNADLFNSHRCHFLLAEHSPRIYKHIGFFHIRCRRRGRNPSHTEHIITNAKGQGRVCIWRQILPLAVIRRPWSCLSEHGRLCVAVGWGSVQLSRPTCTVVQIGLDGNVACFLFTTYSAIDPVPKYSKTGQRMISVIILSLAYA